MELAYSEHESKEDDKTKVKSPTPPSMSGRSSPRSPRSPRHVPLISRNTPSRNVSQMDSDAGAALDLEAPGLSIKVRTFLSLSLL